MNQLVDGTVDERLALLDASEHSPDSGDLRLLKGLVVELRLELQRRASTPQPSSGRGPLVEARGEDLFEDGLHGGRGLLEAAHDIRRKAELDESVLQDRMDEPHRLENPEQERG